MALINTIRVQLHEDYYCEIKKYRGSYGSEYYSVNNINYDIHFPIEWVFQCPIDDYDIPFGPETCYNCFLNGYYNGVFIGYCVNCAYNCNYKRGNGLEYSIEREGLDLNNSIWNLYFQTLSSLEEIGDRQLQIDYDYKIRYYPRIFNVGIDDDITITYNNSVVYLTTECEDDDTIVSFSYNSDSDSDFEEIESIS